MKLPGEEIIKMNELLKTLPNVGDMTLEYLFRCVNEIEVLTEEDEKSMKEQELEKLLKFEEVYSAKLHQKNQELREENQMLRDDLYELSKEYFTPKDAIVAKVIKAYKTRSEVGIAKYGTTLENNNTDDFLQHLQEELMDATLYVEKLKEIALQLDKEYLY